MLRTYKVTANDDRALIAWAKECNMTVFHLANELIMNALADHRKERRMSDEHYTARHSGEWEDVI